MSGRRRLRRTGAGFMVVVALIVASCGDDSAGDDAGPDREAADEQAGFYGGHVSELYGDDANWLCRPGLADDVCERDLDATVVYADGSIDLEPHQRAEDPEVDCFYVYPTVSMDTTPNSDLEPGEAEEIFVTLNQAARLTASCRVFVPVYRQMTLGMIGGGGVDDDDPESEPWEVAYDDVLDAFRHYIDQESEGRGFVLLGHSQGASHLRRLIAQEIDGEPELQDRLVGAYLLGWTVNVPEGELVGGAFASIPACQMVDQVGCVVSYASFRSEPTPPPDPAFGGPGAAVGDPGEDGDMALCVNPASPGGDSAFTRPYFQVEVPEASLVGDTNVQPFADAERTAEITTPWVTYPDFIEVECRYEAGVSYLAVTVQSDPTDERAHDIAGDLDLTSAGMGNWGLHLVDVSIAMGDLVDMVEAQASAYAG